MVMLIVYGNNAPAVDQNLMSESDRALSFRYTLIHVLFLFILRKAIEVHIFWIPIVGIRKMTRQRSFRLLRDRDNVRGRGHTSSGGGDVQDLTGMDCACRTALIDDYRETTTTKRQMYSDEDTRNTHHIGIRVWSYIYRVGRFSILTNSCITISTA